MKVECELILAQNSLIKQSARDEDGNMNVHGWGLAAYSHGKPYVRKQPMPANESEDFRWDAADILATNVLAHVRRATVAPMSIENTHPFLHDEWTFIHNGEIVAYDEVRPHLMGAIMSRVRARIEGETDSELIFRYFISLHEQKPNIPFLNIFRHGIQQLQRWVDLEKPGTELALNIIMTNGVDTFGSRYGRKLWYVERDAVHRCEICGGELHVDENPRKDYRAIVVASERLTTTEKWTEMPEASLFYIDAEMNLEIHPLGSRKIAATSHSH